MENKKIKLSFQRRKGFALLFTIILLAILSFWSYSIVQNNVFQTNLNTLKYMNLQANIHYDYVKEYISTHNDEEIKNLALSDSRFDLKISSLIENNTTSYYVIIEAKDDIPIRLSKKIIK